MSLEYEKRLEEEVSRQLRELPYLPAPATLSARVMAVIEAREQRKRFQTPWPLWPAPLRYAALLALSVLFAGLCWAGWHLCRSDAAVAVSSELGKCLAGAAALGRGLNTVGGLSVNFVKNLQPAVLLGCLAAMALAYGVLVALVTFYLRLGLATVTAQSYDTNPN